MRMLGKEKEKEKKSETQLSSIATDQHQLASKWFAWTGEERGCPSLTAWTIIANNELSTTPCPTLL
jgi:hypothetical protein